MTLSRGPWVEQSGVGLPAGDLNASQCTDLIYQELFPILRRDEVEAVLEALWRRWRENLLGDYNVTIPDIGRIEVDTHYRGPNAPPVGAPNPIKALTFNPAGPLAYEIDRRSAAANSYRKTMQRYLTERYGSPSRWPKRFAHLKPS